MKDAKQRITEYKERLPKVKEKFIAMIALLIVSASMLTTVSFAWLALSRNPEVSGVNTAVAVNGNLEIALASGKLKDVPRSTQIGDGSLNLIDKNTTWGNLINLSDPSYGLSNMVLRPALLNTAALDSNPLRAAVYTADGRFEALSTDFGFAKWMNYTDGRDSKFELTDEFGLRAITSTKFEIDLSGFNAKQKDYNDAAVNANNLAKEEYLKIVGTNSYMTALANLMGTYMTARLNSDDAQLSNPTLTKSDVEGLRDIFRDFSVALATEQEYMVAMANYQIFLQEPYVDGQVSAKIELDDLLAEVNEEAKNNLNTIETTIKDFDGDNIIVALFGLGTNKRDKRIIDEGYIELVELCKQGSITWQDSGIEEILESLVTVGLCEIDGTPIYNIGASNAAGYLSGTHEAVIKDGVLLNYEGRTGEKMYVKGLKIKATVKRYDITLPGTVTANVSTAADEKNAGYMQDVKYSVELLDVARQKANSAEPPRTADETYGFVVDFWVRTNALNSYLNLEGNVLTKTEWRDAKGKDADGNEVQLYTVNESTGESDTEPDGGLEITISRDVYKTEVKVKVIYDTDGTTIVDLQEASNGDHIVEFWRYVEGHGSYKFFKLKDADGANGKWYEEVVGENNSVTIAEAKGVKDPAFKRIEYEVVIGYEGENRVWDEDDSSLITINATTQGSGSCYVFYAYTPEDQQRGLELLSALKVAFVDQNGNMLTEAYLDTERFYSDSGKIIVPLTLNNTVTVTDERGKVHNVIMEMPKNEEVMISAIVYLDGQEISNDNVLATSDIQGQFNIQFGNSIQIDNDPASNDKLESEELILSANINGGNHVDFNYETDSDLTVEITANIEGVEPERVEAFFIRTITSTQGVPLRDVIGFANQGNGIWKANYTFDGPGEYVLRSLRIDGVEYDLHKDGRPTVSISGFSVSSIKWWDRLEQLSSQHRFMTSASAVSSRVEVKFNATKQPQSVVGQFHEITGARTTSVNFSYDATNISWTGTANFSTSGEYVLDMLIVDGEYFDISDEFQKTAEVIVGMKVAISTISPTEFAFGMGKDNDPETGVPGTGMEENEISLKMQMIIMDDSGTPLQGLSNVMLYYSRDGYTAAGTKDAEMTWNSGKGYYEGEMDSEIGTFVFSEVLINSRDQITNATTAPVFNIMPPGNPDVYTGDPQKRTPDSQFTAGAAGKIFMQLVNTTKRTEVVAVLQKYDAVAGKYVDCAEVVGELQGGNISGYDTWVFPTQDASGQYQISKLKFRNAYVNGSLVDSDDPYYVLDLAREEYAGEIEKTRTTILTDVRVEVAPTINLGGTSLDNAYANFMEEKALTGLWADVRADDDSIIAVTGNAITLVYEYQFDPGTYGGYTATDDANFRVQLDQARFITVTLKDSDGDGKFDEIDGAPKFTYAGTYKLKSVSMSIPVGEENKSVTKNADQNLESIIAVYSKKPTVKVNSVSPTASRKYYVTATPNNRDNYVEGSFNKVVSDYEAVVYITMKSDGWWNGYFEPNLPTVSLKLDGIDSDVAFTASMVYNNANYSGNSSTFSFSNTALTSAAVTVGHAVNGSIKIGGDDDHPELYPIGNQTVDEMTLVSNGVTFNVELSHGVTINQPYYPSALSFKINDSTFTGTVPSTVYSQDGETITVTLPTVSSWTEAKESSAAKNYGDPISTTSDTVCTNSWGTWRKYTRTTTVYTATSSISTWTNTKTVTGWIINGVTYQPGQIVTLDATANLTAVAKVSTTEGQKTTTDTIWTKTVVTFVATGDSKYSWNKPSGYGTEVSSVENTTTETHT